jgi:hypothetical protein
MPGAPSLLNPLPWDFLRGGIDGGNAVGDLSSVAAVVNTDDATVKTQTLNPAP